ncbi:MAG: hypothetical protein HOO91_12430 [Bacteroidales bacterium]|nr:hypothetical protein [Bacteroidales bacterium]
MKPIAIHDNKIGFTNRWIEYCSRNSIPFIKVNCYDTNIIEKLKECSALMWHWNYEYYQDYLFARQFLLAVKATNIKVFPEFWTTFLFDDKLGQKYLFESLDIPMPKTYAFYEKREATNWAKEIQYPIVFKLRCGAGSQNVQLVKSFTNAKRLIDKSYSTGFKSTNKPQVLRDRLIKLFRYKNKRSFINVIKSTYRLFIPKFDEKIIHREIGYVMFQEFLPNNDFDTRIIVLGNRCFGIRRYNRKNDFRASGSGFLDYDPEQIDTRAIKLSFDIASKLETRLLALDFLFDKQNNPVVTEMSYGFAVEAYDDCMGYWDNKLIWHEGKQNLQYLMVEDLITEI